VSGALGGAVSGFLIGSGVPPFIAGGIGGAVAAGVGSALQGGSGSDVLSATCVGAGTGAVSGYIGGCIGIRCQDAGLEGTITEHVIDAFVGVSLGAQEAIITIYFHDTPLETKKRINKLGPRLRPGLGG